MATGMFSQMNLNNFRSSKGGNYIKPGRYVARLLSAKGIERRGGETAFVAEFEVLETDSAENHPVGDRPSYFIKLSDAAFPETAKGNIADCMRAMIACRERCEGGDIGDDIDDVEISDDMAELITSDEQPMAGTVMGILATNIVTRKGHDFTKVSFFVPENAEELFA